MEPRNSRDSDPAEATRERILEAAMRLFSRTGFGRTATHAIAAEAGVNEVTLFRHFGSKRNLLLACLKRIQETGFVATFAEHLAGNYPADIAIMARRQMADLVERYDILCLLMGDARQVPEVREVLEAGAAQNARRLADYFQRQIAAGVVRSDLDPLDLAHAFDSLFSSSLLLQSLMHTGTKPVIPPDTAIDALVGLFVRGTQQNSRKDAVE